MSRRILCLAALLISMTGLTRLRAQDTAANQPPAADRRIPSAVIPRMTAPPTIDGVVDRAEWMGASELGPLKVGMSGVADELHRRVFIGYDDQAIYIAYQMQRPAGAVEPAVPSQSGHIDAMGGGDMVEIMFAPDLDFDNTYSFWAYANSAYGEAACRRRKDYKWNVPWQTASRLTETGWEGEVAIPFASFGKDGPPSPDQAWGFDFVDNRRTPHTLRAHWSYRGNGWSRYENFGRIRFAPVPAVRFHQVGEAGTDTAVVEVAIANATADAAAIHTDLRLYRRKDGSEGGPKSFYENIESGMSHDTQVEYTKGVKLDDIVDFAMRFYDPLPGATEQRELSVPAGQRRSVGLLHQGGSGEYLLEYRIRQDEQVLASGVTVFRVEPPLSLTIEPYWLYSKLVDVTADVRKLSPADGATAAISILPAEGDSAPLAQVSAAIPPDAMEVKASVPVGDLPEGFYRVEAVIFDAAGKELARNIASIRKPPTPPWYDNDHGNRIEVPEPWTPVQSDPQGHVSVWARDYDLSRGLPAGIQVNGTPLLASPVAFRIQANGREVQLAVTRLEQQSSSAAKAVYAVELTGGELRLAGTLTAEFDGLLWYDLQLTSAGAAAVTIDAMSLQVDLQPQFAELMGRHKFLVDPVISTRQPEPDLNGAPGILEHAKMPFTPYLWIGNEKGGIGFIAEAPIDWQIDQPNSVLETLPAAGDQPAGLRAHFVQAPKQLDHPMRVQFGLQATPIRAMPNRREILNIYQRGGVWADEEQFQQLADLGCKVLVFYYGWRGDPTTEMGGTPERPKDPEQRQRLKDAVKLAHKHGLKVIMFTGWGINATSDNWKQFGLELGRYPVHNQGWGTFGQSAGPNGGYADFMAWHHADLAREYEVDGVLWDSTSNLSPDTNLRIGTAWVDAEGRVRPRYAVLATREVYRRVYNVYHGEVRKDGVIYNHSGSMWPVNVFADMQNRGEGRPQHAKTLRESWVPFEEFRAEYSAEPFGTLYSGEVNDHKKLPMRVSTHLAVTLLHGYYAKESRIAPKTWTYAYEHRPLIPIWQAVEWLQWDQQTRALYYYQDLAGEGQAVKATPASLLSSAFVSGDGRRALVVVSNLDLEPLTAQVTLDPASLGLAPGTMHVEDAILKTSVPIDSNRMTLEIDQQRYRLLKVSID